MMGEEAAEVFYTPGRFTRRRAMPLTTLLLLQDRGSVQMLDGEAHRWRKQMFLSLMAPERIRELVDLMRAAWEQRVRQWAGAGEIVLHEEVEEILCRAACAWSGIAMPDGEIAARTREFRAMLEGSGNRFGWTWRGLRLRRHTERWARAVIKDVRTEHLRPLPSCAAHVIAWHRDRHGRLLHPRIAAVELINVLRPIVATARFVTFAALALHEHPAARERLRAGGDEEIGWFVQEVRRFYPFFPVIGGRVRQPFEWRGQRFPHRRWVLLDLYGTNHDARIWGDPETFRPERFRSWRGGPNGFIPQGGGDHATTHRCPGEWITIALIEAAVRLLVTGMQYEVPPQDLRIDLRKMPTLPASGLRLARVAG